MPADTARRYLYSIVACPGERIFDGVAAVDGGAVHTIVNDGLGAVVSLWDQGEVDCTRAYLLAHERVQERVAEELAVLPVRFGTIARGPSPADAVRRLLSKRRDEFVRLLAEVDGKAEMGLKARWRDERAVFQELAAEHGDVRRLRDSLQRKPAAVARFEGVALGRMVRQALEQKKRREAARLLGALRATACRTREGDTFADGMFLNAAFLVERGRLDEFDRLVDALDGDCGDRVELKYTGPNPPWNFVEIVVNWSED